MGSDVLMMVRYVASTSSTGFGGRHKAKLCSEIVRDLLAIDTSAVVTQVYRVDHAPDMPAGQFRHDVAPVWARQDGAGVKKMIPPNYAVPIEEPLGMAQRGEG